MIVGIRPDAEFFAVVGVHRQAFGISVTFLQNKYDPSTQQHVGGYGAYFGIDRFMLPSQSHTFASTNRLNADDFGITAFIVGARLDLPGGYMDRRARFIGGIDVGIGFGMIDAVDVRYDQTPTGGGVSTEGFYAATLGFMFEATVRLGAAIRVHERAEVDVVLLLGYNFITAPGNANDSAALLKPADAGLML